MALYVPKTRMKIMLGVSLGEGISKDSHDLIPQAAPVSRGVYPEATPHKMSPRQKKVS